MKRKMCVRTTIIEDLAKKRTQKAKVIFKYLDDVVTQR